jgi:hypothetical protein
MMTTIIEENALNTELQELYLVSKQWLSELTFLENELNFFRKRVTNTDNHSACQNYLDKITNIEKTHCDLKTHILHYLHRLEQFISKSKQPFDINLIENYARIKTELEEFSIQIQSVKRAALALTQQELGDINPTQI